VRRVLLAALIAIPLVLAPAVDATVAAASTTSADVFVMNGVGVVNPGTETYSCNRSLYFSASGLAAGVDAGQDSLVFAGSSTACGGGTIGDGSGDITLHNFCCSSIGSGEVSYTSGGGTVSLRMFGIVDLTGNGDTHPFQADCAVAFVQSETYFQIACVGLLTP